MSPWLALPVAAAAFAAGAVIVFGIDRVILTRIAQATQPRFYKEER